MMIVISSIFAVAIARHSVSTRITVMILSLSCPVRIGAEVSQRECHDRPKCTHYSDVHTIERYGAPHRFAYTEGEMPLQNLCCLGLKYSHPTVDDTNPALPIIRNTIIPIA